MPLCGENAEAEEQVRQVEQDAHLEEAEQLGTGLVAGEPQLVEVRRDARDEAEDPDEHEDDAEQEGEGLSKRPAHGLLRAQTIRSPSSVSDGSTRSSVRACGAIRSARPPVATVCASVPSSSRMRVTIPST